MNGERLEQAVKPFIPLALLVIAFFLCMLSPLNPFAGSGISGVDSSVFRYVGWVMTKGQTPYLDTFDHKGPLIYLLNYLGCLIDREHGIWLVEYAFMVLTVTVTYRIARRFIGRIWSLFTALMPLGMLYLYFNGGNFTEEYALPFQLVSLGIFIDFFLSPEKYMLRGKKKKAFDINVALCGVCFGAVLLLRANMIAVWAAFCLAVLICCAREKCWLDLLRFILSFVIGLLAILLPFVLYFAAKGALSAFVQDYLIYNLVYTSGGGGSTGSIAEAMLHFCRTKYVAFSLVVMLCAAIFDRDRRRLSLAVIFYILVNAVFTGIGGRAYEHYGMGFVPVVVYPAAYLFEKLSGRFKGAALIQLLIAVLLIFPAWYNISYSVRVSAKQVIEGREAPDELNYAELVDYIRSHSGENDLISVYGNNDYVYYASERMAASRYSFVPISCVPERDSAVLDEYFADLEDGLPRMIVLSRRNEPISTFLEQNGYELTYSGANDVYMRP